MKKLDAEVNASGDATLKAQWDQYAKSLEDATRTLMLSTQEGKKVLHGALMTAEGGGFMKESKGGTSILDHQKLAGDLDSITKYRDNVIKSLTANGFSPDEAAKVSDALQKEYFELRGKSLDILQKEQLRKEKSYEPTDLKEKVPVGDIVRNAIKRNDAYNKLTAEAKKEGVDTSKYDPELTFSKPQAETIMLDAIKNSEEYGKMSDYTGEQSIDYTKLALKNPTDAQLSKMISDHLVKNEGVKKSDADRVAGNLIDHGMHDALIDKIETHSQKALDAQQRAIGQDRAPVRKSDMTRMAELHAMGIFDQSHSDLLHHILGIDGADQQSRKDLMEILAKKQQLMERYGSKELLYQSMNETLQHKMDDIIARNIGNKTKLSAVAKAIYNYQHSVNGGIIANAFNIGENTDSGFTANLGQTISIFRQLGANKEALKVFYETGRAWRSVFKDVTLGGPSYGIEGGKFTQRASDKLTYRNWDNLNNLDKARTVLKTYAQAGLTAMDSAYKVAIHMKTTILTLHKALQASGMSRDEASDYLNEHLFGKSLDDARAEAKYMYDKLNLKYDKNTIERSARENVLANIYTDGQLNKDVIDAAIKSSFNVAAIALGHEGRKDATGTYSGAKKMKLMQQESARKYAKLISEGKYNDAAWYHIMHQSLYLNGILKFAHGVANWIVLRPLTAGLGLISGGVAKLKGSDSIDWTNKKTLEEQLERQAQANADINRAWAGLAKFGAQMAMTSLYGMLNNEDKKKGNLAAGFAGIKHNVLMNKAMTKFGADILSLMYVSYTHQQEKGGQMDESYASLHGFGEYAMNLTNVGGGHTQGERLVDITKLFAHPSEANEKKAYGIMGEMLRNVMPGDLEVPYYRSAKGIYYLGKSAVERKAQLPPFYNPQSFAQGFFDNGILNDIAESTGGHVDPFGLMQKKKATSTVATNPFR